MTQRPSDDLFEDTRMSFGEHLEELRKTLVRCLIFIAAGACVGFMVAEDVVNFLQTPLRRAVKRYNDEESVRKSTVRQGFQSPEIANLLEQGLAPESIFVDPGEWLQMIRTVSPDALPGVKLPKPYLLLPKWVPQENVSGITDLLTSSGGADPQQAAKLDALRSMLTAEETAAVAELGSSRESQLRLVALLNRLIEQPLLHQNQAFQPVLSDPPWTWMHLLNPPGKNQLKLMKKKVDENPDDLDLARRLNRLLVAGTFPGLVQPPKIDLVRMEIFRDITRGTQALSPHEVFMVWLKAAIVTGLILAGPFVFHQLWMFVAAGLYPHEQKYVYYYLPISIVLFVLGVCLAFFFVFDPVLQFLFSFNASMGISPQLRIGEWLSFVMFLPLGFGIAFQLPLVMLFANRIGLASTDLYVNNWRLSVLVISVLSMLLTPADPISMIMLGGPLTLLYFFGILLCKWMPKPENPFRDDAIAAP